MLIAALALALPLAPVAFAQECEGWFAIGDPMPRVNPAMVYDSVRGVTVLFGGQPAAGMSSYGSRPMGETWEFDGSLWHFRSLSGPRPTHSAKLAFDSARNVVVMFGGFARSTNVNQPDRQVLSNELWEWNGSTWTQTLATTNWPAARSQHAMGYDPVRQRVVLFGGISDALVGLNDLWEWNGATWTNIPVSPGWPTFTGSASFAWDPTLQQLLLVGSTGGTYAWNGTAFSLITPTSPLPSSSPAANLVYAPASGRMMAVSARNNAAVAQLTPAGWEQIAIAAPVQRDVVASLDSSGNIIAHGITLLPAPQGVSSYRLRVDGTNATWERIEGRPAPAGRRNHAFAHVPLLQGLAMAGGDNNVGALNDSWVLRGNTWIPLNSTGTPGSTKPNAMEWDEARQQLIFVSAGGTKVWTPATRSWINQPNALRLGDSHTSTFDPVRRQMLVWSIGSSPVAWDGSQWNLISTTGSAPSSTSLASCAFDPVRGSSVLLGGNQATASFALTDTTWSIAAPSSPGSWRPLAAYSPQRGGVITFGGFVGRNPDGTSNNFPDGTWFLSSTSSAWQLLPLSGPAYRKYTAHAYDATAERIVMHGGFGFVNTIWETWAFASGPAAIAVQPAPQTARLGTAVELYTVSRGGGPLRYVWRRNGEVLSPRPGLEGTNTDTLRIASFSSADAGTYTVTVSNACGTETSSAATLTALTCDTIDFNNDTLFPSDTDLADFLSVLAGGPCSTQPPTGNGCNDIDFNNDGLFPSDDDLVAFFRVLAGGGC